MRFRDRILFPIHLHKIQVNKGLVSCCIFMVCFQIHIIDEYPNTCTVCLSLHLHTNETLFISVHQRYILFSILIFNSGLSQDWKMLRVKKGWLSIARESLLEHKYKGRNTKDNIYPKQDPTRFCLHPWTVLERKVMIIFLLEEDHKIISEMLVSNRHQSLCLQQYPRAQYRRETFIQTCQLHSK